MSEQRSTDFVAIRPEDEFLHPVSEGAHYTSLESSYFGFNSPAAGVDGQIYVWFHPALKVMTFMIYVWKGIKRHQLSADYFNEHVYLPMVDQIGDYTVEMGSCKIHIKVVKPLEEIRIEIDDMARGFKLDWTTTAVFPPVGRPGGGHFTQIMHNTGELVLRGESYDIDGYFARDRSWGYTRGEEPQKGPPYNWMTCIFGPDLAFHVAVLDTSIFPHVREFGPDWNKAIDEGEATKTMRWDSVATPYSSNLRGGYWFEDSPTPRKLVNARNRTTLGGDDYTPMAIELELEDETGAVHKLTGRTVSFMPKLYGQNCVSNNAFVEWDYNGRKGYGEMLVVYDNEHLHTLDGGDYAWPKQPRAGA